MSYSTFFLVCLSLAASMRTVQLFPFGDRLEWGVRRILGELNCPPLSVKELNQTYLYNSSINTGSTKILNSTADFSYLDFTEAIPATCTQSATKVLQTFEREGLVFPSHYMEWECGETCEKVIHTNKPYQLLERNGCMNGTEIWLPINETLYLDVTKSCNPK